MTAPRRGAGVSATELYASLAPFYYRAGYFPLPSDVDSEGRNLKRSFVSGFTGRSERVPNLEDISEWVKRYPERNICLRLPHGVIGIDVDDYDDKVGGAAIQQWQADAGASLPPTFVCTSRGPEGASGVRLYRIAEPLDSNGVVCEDVELIDHTHRVMCAPPSIHPKTGQRYRFYDPDGNVYDGVPPVSALALLPAALHRALQRDRGGVGTRSAVFTPDSSRSAALPANELTEAGARRIMNDAPDGDRHNVALSAILSAENHRARGRDTAAFMRTLRDTFIDAVAPTRGADTAAAEFDSMVTGAERKAASTPAGYRGTLPQPAPLPRTRPEHTPSGAPLLFPRKPLSALAAASGTVPKPELLVRDDGHAGIYSTGISTLIGPPESMKTLIALHTAAEVMRAGGDVVYIDLEDTPASILRRLEMLGVPHRTCDQRFIYRNASDFTPDAHEGEHTMSSLLSAYLQTAEVTSSKLVVVDTIPALTALLDVHTFADGAEYSKMAQTLFQPLSERTAVLLIDHTSIGGADVHLKPLGVTAKVSTVKGSSLSAHVLQRSTADEPRGVVELIVAKDNNGGVRAATTATKRGLAFAVFDVVFEQSDSGVHAHVSVRRELDKANDHSQPRTGDASSPGESSAAVAPSVRTAARTLSPIPDGLDSDALALLSLLRGAALPMSINQLAAATSHSKKNTQMLVERLVSLGVVEQSRGPRNALLHIAI